MNFLASVLIALLAWALLSWVCGIAVGCMIDLMEGEDEFDDPWVFQRTLSARRRSTIARQGDDVV